MILPKVFRNILDTCLGELPPVVAPAGVPAVKVNDKGGIFLVGNVARKLLIEQAVVLHWLKVLRMHGNA